MDFFGLMLMRSLGRWPTLWRRGGGAIAVGLLVTGSGAPTAANPGPTTRSQRYLACLQRYGAEPNNRALELCSGGGGEMGDPLPAPANVPMAAPASVPAPRPPQARPAIATPARPPATPQATPQAAIATPYRATERMQAALACLGRHGSEPNAILGECGAWGNVTFSGAMAAASGGGSNNIFGSSALSFGASGAIASGGSAAAGRSSAGLGASGGNGNRRGEGSAPAAGNGNGNGNGFPVGTPARTPGSPRTAAGIPGFFDPDRTPFLSPNAQRPERPTPYDGNNLETDLGRLGLTPSGDALERGTVSPLFDPRLLAEFICIESGNAYRFCRARLPDAPSGPGGAIIAANSVPFTCATPEAELRAQNAARLTAGDTTFYIGYEVKERQNFDPIVARFDRGRQTWCRNDYELTRDDSTGVALLWDGGDRFYGAFTDSGDFGEAGEDFRRFTASGWLNRYGLGSGAAATVILRLDPATGVPRTGTYVTALQGNGASGRSVLQQWSLGADGTVQLQLDSGFFPRRSDRAPFQCRGGLGGLTHSLGLSENLDRAVASSAPGCS
jgi:hypothetical protein